MTNKQVDDLIATSAARGHDLDDYDAKVFLGARETLAREPGNVYAERTVEEYALLILHGTRPTGFDHFLLDLPFYTDEELADHERSRLQYYAQHPNEVDPKSIVASR